MNNSSGGIMESHAKKLVLKITCPNCWHRFTPDEVLFISKHPELLGDSIAGNNEYMRFSPIRFTIKGEALDPKGFPTTELACPECHLPIPESMLETAPLFISLIGAPASGKSYFLGTMIWELRRLMPKFNLLFSDADPVANGVIHEYEQTLFMNTDVEKPTEIPKTQTDDPRLYRTILRDDTPVRCPRPLQFIMWPTDAHKNYSQAQKTSRIVVMYDNAGEDFLPQSEDSSSVVVQHLAKSQILLMFFDPTQDARFKALCNTKNGSQSENSKSQIGPISAQVRQETLLRNAAVRIRRHLGLPDNSRIKTPLIVIVPKFDTWNEMAGISLDDDPFKTTSENKAPCLDIELIERHSEILHKMFQEICPEFVATAKNLTATVRFIPVSSLGSSPELVTQNGRSFYGVRPSQVKPKWVAVPLAYALSRWASGMIPRLNGNGQARSKP